MFAFLFRGIRIQEFWKLSFSVGVNSVYHDMFGQPGVAWVFKNSWRAALHHLRDTSFMSFLLYRKIIHVFFTQIKKTFHSRVDSINNGHYKWDHPYGKWEVASIFKNETFYLVKWNAFYCLNPPLMWGFPDIFYSFGIGFQTIWLEEIRVVSYTVSKVSQ